MQPLPPDWDEDDEYDPDIHRPGLLNISDKLDAAVMEAMDSIKAATNRVPGLRKRNRQLWSPLYRMALAAGGTWPEDVLEASRELTLRTGSTKKIVTPDEQLFEDIEWAIRNVKIKGNLSTQAIVSAMMQLEVPSIATFTSSGQAARAINQVMADHGVPAMDVWFNKAAAQGFKRADLDRLFGLEGTPSQNSSQAPSEDEAA
jgi:hypothetical protein